MPFFKNNVRRVVCIASAIFLTLAAVVWAYGAVQAKRAQQDLKDLHASIAALCIKKYDEPGRTHADIFRECVHKSTAYRVDAEFYDHWKDNLYMASAVLAYLEGKREEKPHYECATRAGLMIGLLKSENVPAQDLIIARFDKEFSDHVVVGVADGAGGSWRVHDPSYNIYYKDLSSGRPATAHELIKGSPQNFVPCEHENSCGWNIVSSDKFSVAHLRGLWGILAYKAEDGIWGLIYNPEKFDPHKLNGNRTYCETRKKYCRKPPVSIGG